MKSARSYAAILVVSSTVLSVLTGCSSSKKSTAPPPVTTPPVDTYFAMTTEKPTTSAGGLSSGYTFTLDHSASIFDQEDISGGSPLPINRGPFASGNGFLLAALDPFQGQPVTIPETGNWLLEREGVMGFAYISAPDAAGLDGNVSGPQGQRDTSQNLIPFIGNTSCPNVATQQTYQFLTFPGNTDPQSWDYLNDTAYGTLQIATLQSGAVVNLSEITQYLLPETSVLPGTAVIANPGPADISGSCGASADGSMISVSYIDRFGVPHYAELNLASGFLLEMNTGIGVENQGISNIIGAGYGAVGMLQPSAAVDTMTLISDSFQGFVHVPDSYTATSAFSGGASTSSACKSFIDSLNTLPSKPSASTVYGGEYADNNPSATKSSNCDMAIDLGPQDAKNNGLYTAATIYVGAAFPLNNANLGIGPGVPYSFPAIAIAGKINGQNAVFVLAEDTVAGLGHPLAIYLLHAQ